MRTTLNIDDDVLQAARELARAERRSAGKVISDLVRRQLATGSGLAAGPDAPETVLGFRPFPRRGGLVTNELVNRLREEDPY
jgi:hypothetical protein